MGVTAILVSCLFRDREFLRVGYFVNNTYDNDEMNSNPPSRVDITKVIRNIGNCCLFFIVCWCCC